MKPSRRNLDKWTESAYKCLESRRPIYHNSAVSTPHLYRIRAGWGNFWKSTAWATWHSNTITGFSNSMERDDCWRPSFIWSQGGLKTTFFMTSLHTDVTFEPPCLVLLCGILGIQRGRSQSPFQWLSGLPIPGLYSAVITIIINDADWYWYMYDDEIPRSCDPKRDRLRRGREQAHHYETQRVLFAFSSRSFQGPQSQTGPWLDAFCSRNWQRFAAF